MYQWCLSHREDASCAQLCQQPEGEGRVCWCMATSRNGGTGPASAPTLTRRCSCTLGVRLHIKGILHHWRESCFAGSGVPRCEHGAHREGTDTIAPHAVCRGWSCMFTVPPTQLLKCCVWENNLAAPIAHRGWARSCTSRENGRVTSQVCPAPCKDQTHLPRSCPEVSDHGWAVPW